MFRWRQRRGTHIVADVDADTGAHRDANATWRCDHRADADADADCDRIAHTDADATAVGARDRDHCAAAAQ